VTATLESRRDPRQVFVVGCYRSGTTLVESIVRSHPDVVGLGFETLLFTHVVPRRSLPAYNDGRWEAPLERYLGVSSWQQVPDDPREVFDAIATSLAKEHDASVFVEKTPFHLFHVERILEQDPAARVLLVVRDGRDVVTSVLAGDYPLGRWPSRRLRLLAACVLWEQFVCEGHRLMRLQNERFQTVYYEDVVRAPRATLDHIAGFLGLDHSGATLSDWFDRTRDIGSNSSFEPMHGISDEPAGRWRERQDLRPGEADLIDYLIAPTLELTGYESTAARLTWGRALAARTQKTSLALARVAQFKRNTSYAPRRHIWHFLGQSSGLHKLARPRRDPGRGRR